MLGPATLFTAILALGVLWTLDAIGVWNLPEQVPWSTALAILGAGLIVGAFAGRARWLAWVCLPVAFALLASGPSSQALSWTGSASVGDRTWQPESVSQIPDAYALGVGTGVLDLSSLDLPADPDAVIEVQARVDMGTLEVVLPAATRALIDARADMGTVEIAGTASAQGGMDQHQVIELAGSPRAPTLDLRLSVGMGTVEVRRAATFG